MTFASGGHTQPNPGAAPLLELKTLSELQQRLATSVHHFPE
jgi:hypothetical protein